MQHPGSLEAGVHVRRLILGAAFAVGLAFAMAPHTDSVRAADLRATIVAQADASKAPGSAAAPAEKARPRAEAPKGDAANADAEDSDADSHDDAASSSKGPGKRGNHGIFIEKGGRKIRIEGLGDDREYDSFQQFINEQPWVAGLFFLTLMVLFLVPLLIIALLIWYKLRKNRMAHQTMLELAERGIVPPATAMDAVASGTAASVAAAATPPPSLPAYEQARYLRRRAVWSDLRKGVILTAIGIGLNFWSMFDDGTANGFGLILLFVGIGYCVLWFFEDRTTTAPPNAGTTPPPGSA